ncbi:MAG: single-stranded-DNA-specific exonuclease RecJ [Coprococcus sp.]
MSEYKKEEWRVKQPTADIRALAEQFSISPILAHIIVNREITEPDAVARYLSDDLAYAHDPALMKDMDKGCQIMKEKIRAGKKIRIISDYDVDGITSNYILYQGLQKAGADVSYDIPHRIMDGYGMNVRLVEAAYADGVDTIITCDNGIAAETAVTRAKELGMTVIVTDHHEVPCEVTENGEKNYLYVNADAVIDPHRPDCAYPYKGLCGAGVAYKFIRHLYRVTELPWEDEDAYMDILALGTVCDIMPH